MMPVKQNHSINLKTCLIAVGKFGIAVADKIQGIKNMYRGTSNMIWNVFDIFPIEENHPYSKLSFNNYDLMFLAGSIQDAKFQEVRQSAKDIQPFLIQTIVDIETDFDINSVTDSIYPEEILILPCVDSIQTAAHIIQDFYSLFSIRPLIPIDLHTTREIFGGCLCYCLSVEGSNEDVMKLINDSQETAGKSKGIFFILSHYKGKEIILDEILGYCASLNDSASDDTAVCFTFTYIQKIQNEVRGAMFYIADSSRPKDSYWL
jgi:hypothetical protein